PGNGVVGQPASSTVTRRASACRMRTTPPPPRGLGPYTPSRSTVISAAGGGSAAERESLRVEFRAERIKERHALDGPSVLRVLSQHVADLSKLRGRPDERIPEGNAVRVGASTPLEHERGGHIEDSACRG